MQKSKIATISIIFVILAYGLISSLKLVYAINKIYLYVLNPLFWIILSVFLLYALGKNFENKRLKKVIIQYTIIAVLSYVIIYMLSGLAVTFGKNPYSVSVRGLIINLWITGIALIFKEYVRYKLINNVYDRDKNKIAILITIVYVIIDIEFIRFMGNRFVPLTVIKYISQAIVPNIARNILFSYIAMNGNLIPAIIYQIVINLYYWLSPIIPNAPWVMTSIVDTVVPMILFLYIIYEKNKLSVVRSRTVIESANPRNIIPLIILIILAIWFALGIFPIKPVSIASGSMEKELFVGDVAVIKKCNSNNVKVGDIIEYQMEGYTVIHRIMEKKQKNGEFYFITKGDNNNTPDKNEVREDQLIGKVIFKIRYIGYPAIWMHLMQEQEKLVEVETK